MRELKFRAWDGKQLGYFTFEDICANGDYIYTDKGNEFNSDMEIMQYTGLKDKNGKDIYEGDIVDWFDESFKVVFHYAAFDLQSKTRQIPIYEVKITETKIIGNIHENPELLE